MTELPRIESAALARLPHVRHGFFTRQGGVSAGLYARLNTGQGSADDPAAVTENRARCARCLGLEPSRLVTLFQVHSARAVAVATPWRRGEAPEADGMSSSATALGLGILAADCAPVLLADATAPVVGAAHAGWKGAQGGILEATLAAMEQAGAARQRVIAVVGPCISQANYEVGPEFEARFTGEDPHAGRFFRRAMRVDHWLFDLPGYVGARLARAGVGEVEVLGRCTYAEEALFYSFRRATHRGEPDYGRALSVIALA